MPPVRRVKPPVYQIADHYEEQIRTGQIRAGEQLPIVPVIAAQFGVSNATAGRAIQLLRAHQVVSTSRAGTFAGPRRLVPGPHDRATMTSLPAAELVLVNHAAEVPAPDYVADILLLDPQAGSRPGGARWVIRREQIHYDLGPDGREQEPFMLSVEWFPTALAGPVPELLDQKPLPTAAAITLITARTGQYPSLGTIADEARPILDDGREGLLLRVPPGYVIMAKTYTWTTGTDVLVYGEYDLTQRRVTVTEFPGRT